MATSQFTIYSSSDPYGPGPLNGLTGSLIPVLDACLVNGYGTDSYFKKAAGWTKPLGNISASCVSAYTQPSGSGFTMFVNDNGAVTTKEAQITGWILMTSLSNAVNNSNVGTGYGQFPLPTQALVTGHTVWRKSFTTDTVQRPWIIFADAYTIYIFVQDGQLTNYWWNGAFGDFWSCFGAADKGRCMLYGKHLENSATNLGYDMSDSISQGLQFGNNSNILAGYMPGHFIARTPAGTGASIRFNKKGDSGISSGGNAAAGEAGLFVRQDGILPAPNPIDNSYYLSPLWLLDPQGIALRGRYRGMYQVGHTIGSFQSGQVIQGSGQYAGKSFMIIQPGYNNGLWGMEISATVDIN